MKYAVRNKFKGKVVDIKKGNLMCEVIVEVSPEVTITSVMTLDSLNDTNINIGDEVVALTKAVNVVLVKQ
jgi:molybdate transport system regulatory protein